MVGLLNTCNMFWWMRNIFNNITLQIYHSPEQPFPDQTSSCDFLSRVKLPRFNANNFCVIRRIKARVVVGFHKITGFSENLSAKTDNMFKIPCLPQDPQPLLHFQVKSSSVPKTENAKVKLFKNIIAAVPIWTWVCRFLKFDFTLLRSLREATKKMVNFRAYS